VRIPLPLLACCLIAVASRVHAQVPTPPPVSGEGFSSPAQATALPEIALEAILEVALDAQPAAPAAFDQTTAYLPLKGGRMVAIDLRSGHVRWSTELSTTLAPSVSAGVVVVATDELLTAFDGPSGRVMWRVPVAGGFSAPPLVDNGWVIAAATTGDLVAVRATDGQVLWTSKTGAAASARPVIAGTAVYVSLADGRIVSAGLNDGVLRWERQLGGKPGDLLVLDDRLFAGADDKFFYALKTSNGDVRWRQRVGGKPAGAAAVDTERVYYVPLDNILWAFHRGNGGRQWHAQLPVRPSGGPLVVGDLVFVAGIAAEVYGYRVKTGAPAGAAKSPADLAAAPQLIPAEIPVLTSVATVTRSGVFTLLARRIEPAAGALPYPLGTGVPLSALGTY
jgi:outer membrane protein assembly factor BamB